VVFMMLLASRAIQWWHRKKDFFKQVGKHLDVKFVPASEDPLTICICWYIYFFHPAKLLIHANRHHWNSCRTCILLTSFSLVKF
jgi:hypothetical protein